MVSIVIPTYNRQEYISETLNSLLEQTCSNWECIIVDDGSTDNTEKILSKYFKDKRFRFYHRPIKMPKGANSCRNYGFLKSKGEYIKFLDSDDLLIKDCLEKQLDIMERDIKLKVCLSYGQFFNDKTKVREEFWSRNREYSSYLTGHITNQIRWAVSDPLWRKSFFSDPPFEEGLMNSQEWLMHGKAMIRLDPDEIYNLKETFTLIRRGNARMSSNKSTAYYENQKLARIYLLREMVKMKGARLIDWYQLVKQIALYYYWELKNK